MKGMLCFLLKTISKSNYLPLLLALCFADSLASAFLAAASARFLLRLALSSSSLSEPLPASDFFSRLFRDAFFEAFYKIICRHYTLS